MACCVHSDRHVGQAASSLHLQGLRQVRAVVLPCKRMSMQVVVVGP